MQPYEPPGWYHSHRYSADSACEHCGGIIRHQPWCVRRNATVSYAYAAVRTSQLTLEDQLILHALGVSWTADKPVPAAALPAGTPRK